MTTEIIAVFGSCSQAGPAIPNHPRTVFTSPSCGLYIQFQNWETTVEASRKGMKKLSRQNHCPGRPMFTSTASSIATSTSGIVESTVNHTVLPSDVHTCGSPSASFQFASPTNWVFVPASEVPVKLIHSP